MADIIDNTDDLDTSVNDIIERAKKGVASRQQQNLNKDKKNIINTIEKKTDTFQSLDQEKLDLETQSIIDNALKNIKVKEVKKDIIPGIKKANPVNSKLSNDIQSYIGTLPDKDKDKVLRYADIFRDNPAPVIDYINDIKKFGSEAEAKKQGGTSKLLNPNDVDWIKQQGDLNEDAKRFLKYS